jgi:hypothetical protein
MSRKIAISTRPGTLLGMEDFGFDLVCANCLATRGVLDSERLPEYCTQCGARDPWKGPFAEPRFTRVEQLAESPFYLGASGSDS